jgi:hypothetical protein
MAIGWGLFVSTRSLHIHVHVSMCDADPVSHCRRCGARGRKRDDVDVLGLAIVCSDGWEVVIMMLVLRLCFQALVIDVDDVDVDARCSCGVDVRERHRRRSLSNARPRKVQKRECKVQ